MLVYTVLSPGFKYQNVHLMIEQEYNFFIFSYSSPILYLEKGKRYYMEAFLGEIDGEEYMMVGYKYTDEETTVRSVTRDLLQPFA